MEDRPLENIVWVDVGGINSRMGGRDVGGSELAQCTLNARSMHAQCTLIARYNARLEKLNEK